MKIIIRLVALLLSMILMALCVSCEHNTNVVLSTVVEPTFTPVTTTPTMIPTAVPSPTPTSTPVLTATEAAFSEERRAELNQQIQDFLNYQGEYSEENIQQYLLPRDHGEPLNLGLIYINESTLRNQSWLFDYMEKDGDLLFIVGFDGKDNQRFATVLNIPLSILKKSPIVGEEGVALVKLDSWSASTGERVIGFTSDRELIESHLTRNKPLLTNFYVIIFDEKNAEETGGEGHLEVVRYYNNNASYIGDLLSQINQNGIEIKNNLKSQDKQISKIEELSDINDIDNYSMPNIRLLIYK